MELPSARSRAFSRKPDGVSSSAASVALRQPGPRCRAQRAAGLLGSGLSAACTTLIRSLLTTAVSSSAVENAATISIAFSAALARPRAGGPTGERFWCFLHGHDRRRGIITRSIRTVQRCDRPYPGDAACRRNRPADASPRMETDPCAQCGRKRPQIANIEGGSLTKTSLGRLDE